MKTPLKISNYDTDDIIRKKIFVNDIDILDPSFIKFNNTSKSKKSSSKNYTNIISDIQKKDISKVISITDLNSHDLNVLFNQYKNNYPNITLKNFKLAIMYIQYNTIPGFYEVYRDELNIWYNNINNERKTLYNNYKNNELDNLSITTKKSFVDIDASTNLAYYSILTIRLFIFIKKEKNDDKTSINIDKIINEYPLDNNIPLMYNKNKKFKIYEKFKIDNNLKLGQDQLKLWLPKKQKKTKYISDPRLNFRIREKNVENSKSIKYYKSLLSGENSRLYIILNFDKESFVSFNDIQIILKNTMKPFINNINDILDSQLNLFDMNIRSTNIYFNIKRNLPYNILIYIAQKKFDKILKLEPKKTKNILTFKCNVNYDKIKNINATIIINNANTTNDLLSRVTVTNAKNSFEIDYIINLVVLIYYNAENDPITRNHIKSVKPILKITKNIKNLRNIGIDVSSAGCQRERQPTFITADSEIPNNINYPLIDPKTKFTLVCKNKKYSYPGFTNNNIVCCFKRDQRNKLIFKRNIGTASDILFNDSDTTILKSQIITTSKVLELNRLGVIPKGLNNLFDINKLKKYNIYRLGNLHDFDSIIHAVELLIYKKIDIFNITEKFLTEKIFKSLNNGDLANIMSYNDYKKYLESIEFKELGIIDLLSKYTNINIVVINWTSNKYYIECIPNTNYRHYCFIMKRIIDKKIYFEPLVGVPITQNKKSKILRIFVDKFTIIHCKEHTNQNELKNINEIKIYLTIKSQFIDSYNKVTYIDTLEYGIIPIYPSGLLIKYPISHKFNFDKLNSDKQFKYLQKLSKKSNTPGLTPVYQIIDNKNCVMAILTKSNIIVPVKRNKINLNIPIIRIENIIDSGLLTHSNTLIQSKSKFVDIRYKYNLLIAFSKELYQRLRYTLNHIIKNNNINLKNHIDDKDDKLLIKKLKNILNDYVLIGESNLIPDVVPNIKYICGSGSDSNKNISDPFCKNDKLYIPRKYYNNLIKKISNDIINYTKNGKDLIEGRVKKEFIEFGIIKRSNEKIVELN